MRRFVKKILFFSALITSIISGLFFYFYRIGGDDLPAPNFSNSISFNEKIDFLKSRDLSKIEYAVLGSSMALNNISSETMSESLGQNYINLASWGFKISDSKIYLENMADFFPDLKTVIISTGFMDFSGNVRNIKVNYGMIKNTIRYRLNNLAYLFSLDLKYLYSSSKQNKAKKQIRNSYDNLVYDEYGGAILDFDSEKIDKVRWQKDILEFDVSETELQNLDSLIKFLNMKGIRCVIAVPPQRDGLLNEDKLNKINTEIKKIRNVVENSNGVFVNSYDIGGWDDSLFVDFAHLNKTGAERYTEYILSRIKW